MIVEDVMIPKPYTIKKEKSLHDAQSLMVKHSIRHLPVVEKGSLIGIITESDIRGAFVLGGGQGHNGVQSEKNDR
ncbi:hypothetical protein UZ36_02805 [Candidatus Nitromaritima sp. SCGC AAA799-C22]|nr:hypothetical protein UZ36_02805 [Candidatus Nitromaritima sp. SCGC AAA799-C22]